jgi:ABC-type amino acid transport substrate-binding protein
MFRSIAFSLTILAAACGVSVHAEGLDGRLKKIVDTKTINIAYRMDAAPFSFVNDSKQIAGFSIDLCTRVVNSIERQLKVQSLKVNWVLVTVQTRFDAIIKGEADMECGSSTVTLSRLKVVDFSSYIFLETTGLVVKTASGLHSLSDMSGKKIAVIRGTTNERAINAQLKRFQLDTTVVQTNDADEALAALEGGRVDAFASDKLLLVGASARAKDSKSLTMLPDDLSFEPYGITLPHGDPAFRLAVNTGLAQIYRSGEVGEIFSRWFRSFGKPSPIIEAIYILGAIPE